MTQKWIGLELDKDIIKPMNKLYSPTTCCFVPSYINSLITNRGADRGSYKIGVTYNERDNMFNAFFSKNGRNLNLGSFSAEEDAAQVYRTAKSNHILEIAKNYSDERVSNGLLLHADLYLNPQ